MSRLRTRWTRPNGFTLIEFLIVVGIVAILATVVIASLKEDPKHNALEAKARQACASGAATPGSFTVTAAEVPAAVETKLGAALSPILRRRVEWNRVTVGDRVSCVMRYVYDGREAASGRGVSNPSQWEDTD
jgi:prepilin-type N-terminal cleavage/methylation domain-containing protein